MRTRHAGSQGNCGPASAHTAIVMMPRAYYVGAFACAPNGEKGLMDLCGIVADAADALQNHLFYVRNISTPGRVHARALDACAPS